MARTLLDVQLASLPIRDVDVAVIGTGVAGLTLACSLAQGTDVALFSKGRVGTGSTPWAQGGIAAAVGSDDGPANHSRDTVVAGVGLCDPVAVHQLANGGPDAIRFLAACGVRLEAHGDGPALTLEGGHSHARILHAGGDATGAEISRGLLGRAHELGVPLVGDSFLIEILTDEDGATAGALMIINGSLTVVAAPTVVLASGGAGQLYGATTSPRTCTGDGIAAALRAGATVQDLEFVQFHPTVFHVDLDPRPLISEAMRGEGAALVDRSGQRIMAGVHPLGDLAPRDVVTRAMTAAMLERGVDHLYLDARPVGSRLADRFPNIVRTCGAAGIDPSIDPIPVSPAAHYSMGGVRTDVDGRTDLPGLFAVGEAASSGVHGANRLASNSLLEGVVFGRRVADAVGDRARWRAKRPDEMDGAGERTGTRSGKATREWLRASMVERAGVVRTGRGLDSLADGIVCATRHFEIQADNVVTEDLETANLLQLAAVLTHAAQRRTESRGAHFRTDFPAEDRAWERHQTCRRDVDGDLVFGSTPVGA